MNFNPVNEKISSIKRYNKKEYGFDEYGIKLDTIDISKKYEIFLFFFNNKDFEASYIYARNLIEDVISKMLNILKINSKNELLQMINNLYEKNLFLVKKIDIKKEDIFEIVRIGNAYIHDKKIEATLQLASTKKVIDNLFLNFFSYYNYNQNDFNSYGYNRTTNTYLNIYGKDIDGLDRNELDKDGLDKNGYDTNGFNPEMHYIESYNITKYDDNGFDKFGFDINCKHKSIHEIKYDKLLDAILFRKMLKHINNIHKDITSREIYESNDKNLKKLAKSIRHTLNGIIHNTNNKPSIKTNDELFNESPFLYLKIPAKILDMDYQNQLIIFIEIYGHNYSLVQIKRFLEIFLETNQIYEKDIEVLSVYFCSRYLRNKASINDS